MSRTLNFEAVPLADLCEHSLNFDQARFRPMVLIVDDERLIADTLCAILTQSGFACMTAYDGESALDLVHVIPPQLLITDVAMPGMNGIDLAVGVKELVPDCQVLLFSGQAATVDLLADPKYAFHNFVLLSKPLHPRQLLAHISTLGPELEVEGAHIS
jgi:DNA-binding response OmpR family regulator